MDFKLIKEAIDYYLAQTSTLTPYFISSIAVLIALAALGVSIYTFHGQQRENIYNYLSTLWNDILNICYENSRFLDINITENYDTKMDDEERFKYDAFCYKAWGFVEDIIVKKFHTDIQFEPIIHWITAYHVKWLEANPIFFTIKEFWNTIERIKGDPHVIFRHRRLPQIDGEIDWGAVAEDCLKYVISPYAPEMVTPNESGEIRNILLRDLLKRPVDDLAGLEIADFGCGCGNLIPHLQGKVQKLTGIDKSEKALELAEKTAATYGIEFVKYQGDFSQIKLGKQFDIIVCVNSILPPQRDDVVPILKNLRDHLHPHGLLMAILPSFDTISYLKNLWHQHYVRLYRDAEHGDRIIRSFDINKKVDDSTCCFADDGCISQCYHTPETIKKEFEEAGLALKEEPEKVYYPWDLTKKFDYGYFPKAEEEIWDWYVVGVKALTA